MAKTIALMNAEIRALNTDKGWRTGDNTAGDYIALLHSEISEMLEAFRDRGLDPFTTEAGKPDDVASETADVFIRVLDTCDVFGIGLPVAWEVLADIPTAIPRTPVKTSATWWRGCTVPPRVYWNGSSSSDPQLSDFTAPGYAMTFRPVTG